VCTRIRTSHKENITVYGIKPTTVPNKKSDIIICDNEKKKETCMLIDVAVARERNVIKKEAKKILP